MPHRLPPWSEVHAEVSPRAQALEDWLLDPGLRQGPGWRERFAEGWARLLAEATVKDCLYVGFRFEPGRSPLRGRLSDQGWLGTVEFCGDDARAARHRAVCVSWIDDYGARAWVDGVELPVPRAGDGCPLADPHLTGWSAGRWWAIGVGGLLDHPLDDPAEGLWLGSVRGLLVWDAQRRAAHLELPRHDELWTAPAMAVEEGELRIWASREEVGLAAPARRIALARAFGGA